MNAAKRYYQLFLLCLVTLGFSAIRPAQGSWSDGAYGNGYDDESEDYFGETYSEEAYALWTASGGVCTCSASTITKSTSGDTAFAEADAGAAWVIDWTWGGAPGEAKGGLLDWSLEGTGVVEVSGKNTPPPDPETAWSGTTYGWAEIITAVYSTAGYPDPSYSAELQGSAENDDEGTQTWNIGPDPDEDSTFTTYPPPSQWGGDPGAGTHDIDVAWTIDADAVGVEIEEGVAYFHVTAAVGCDNWSWAYASGDGAKSKTSTNADANADLSGTFEPVE